jgi:general stress protein YciG
MTSPDPEARAAAALLGRKGGLATKARYGPDHYIAIGSKGGAATKERHGQKFYGDIGRKGGKVLSDKSAARKADKA